MIRTRAAVAHDRESTLKHTSIEQDDHLAWASQKLMEWGPEPSSKGDSTLMCCDPWCVDIGLQGDQGIQIINKIVPWLDELSVSHLVASIWTKFDIVTSYSIIKQLNHFNMVLKAYKTQDATGDFTLNQARGKKKKHAWNDCIFSWLSKFLDLQVLKYETINTT